MPAGRRHGRRLRQCGRCILVEVVAEPRITVVDAPQSRLVELTAQQLEPATGSFCCLLL
jgi:hypothetical protein